MSHPFDAPTVIRTKRDGGALSDAAIDWVIDAYTDGRVADEQMSALLMAIFLRGMTAARSRGGRPRWWTRASGWTSPICVATASRCLVDKHSTGGVGDKITLPLVPVVVACGGAVPQAAGRGLGHTGGTLDKLESIPGFTAEISKDQIRATTLRARRGDLRGGRAGAGRPQDLRAARRHRHHRVAAADRQLGDEQEDRRGHRRAGARRQGRLGRVPEDRGRVPRAGRAPWSSWAPSTGCRPARC